MQIQFEGPLGPREGPLGPRKGPLDPREGPLGPRRKKKKLPRKPIGEKLPDNDTSKSDNETQPAVKPPYVN
jgi:hypothetical protein